MRELKAKENQQLQLMNMNLLQLDKFNGGSNILQTKKSNKIAKIPKGARKEVSPSKFINEPGDFQPNKDNNNDRFDDLMADYQQQMLAAKQMEDAVASGIASPAAAVAQFTANKGKQIEEEIAALEAAE